MYLVNALLPGRFLQCHSLPVVDNPCCGSIDLPHLLRFDNFADLEFRRRKSSRSAETGPVRLHDDSENRGFRSGGGEFDGATVQTDNLAAETQTDTCA